MSRGGRRVGSRRAAPRSSPPRLIPRTRPGLELLPVGRARVRRRPRGAAAPERRGRGDRVGLAAGVSRRIRRRPGGARAALHVLGLSRRDPGAVTDRGRRCRDRPLRDLPTLVPSARGGAPALVGSAGAAAVAGIGAAVVGLLAAALWDPVLSTAVDGFGDVAFALVLFGLLRLLPPWGVVGIAAVAGAIVY
jgi:hypothetical protein